MEPRIIAETKIEGDLIAENEHLIFENDIEIIGSLKAKSVNAKGNIIVRGNYIVDGDDIVVGFQIVGGYQKVGGSQIVGGFQIVGGDITVNLYIATMRSIRCKGKITCGKNYTIAAGLAAKKDNTEGRVIEAVEINGTVVAGIVKLLPKPAKIVIDGQEKEVSSEQLEKIKAIIG